MNFKSSRYIIWGSTFLIFLTGLLLLLTQVQKSKPAKPSIILIFADCLRPDHLGCYGYPKNTSPNIDRFAKEGLLFENCFSHAPDTRLSYSSILTGFLPHETKVLENIVLSAEIETLPEILQQLGYKTIGVVSNYLLRKNRGWEQGFLIYDDIMNQCEPVRQWPERIAEYTAERRTDFVQHIDIVPTILNIIGFRLNPYYHGCDLQEKHIEGKEIFSEMDSFIIEDIVKFSLILDSLELIYTPLYKEYKLFDLRIDPYEKNNLIDRPKHQQQAEDLKLRLHSIRKQDFLGIGLIPAPPQISDEEKQKLESLGYVQY